MKKCLSFFSIVLLILLCILDRQAVAYINNLDHMWPLPGNYSYSRTFAGHSKKAIDIAAAKGTPVHASIGGYIEKYYNGCSNENGIKTGSCATKGICHPNDKPYNGYCNQSFGNGLIIHGDDGLWYQYAHFVLDSVPEKFRAVGARVEIGEVIGKVGSSGAAGGENGGYHLHFEINSQNGFNGHINPEFNAGFIKYVVGRKINITVDNGYVTGAQSGEYFESGKTVTLTATPNENYTFIDWTVSGISISDTSANPLTFTMPNNDVTIQANIKLKLGVVVESWSSNATAGRTDAAITGTLTVDASKFLLTTMPHNVTDVKLMVSADYQLMSNPIAAIVGAAVGGAITSGLTNLYTLNFDLPSATVSDISGGKRYVYSFSASTVKGLKNLAGIALSLSPGTTYYYFWSCKVNDETCRTEVKKFTTASGSAVWETPYVNSENGNFYAWVDYNKNILSLTEVGIFISSDESSVNAAKYGACSSNVATRNDKNENNININNDYNTDHQGLMVFYRQSYFSLTPGITYYYKFYSVDLDGEIVYSSTEHYTIPGQVTQYAFTVQSSTGGTVSTSLNGNYAAGNIVSLIATPATGYTFARWEANAGILENETCSVTNFIMPASNATVTAKFALSHFYLNLNVTNNGGDIISDHSPTYAYGAKVYLKAVPKEGYRFIGWYSDNGGTFADASAAETIFTMPAGGVNIYADFALIDYRIISMVMGGSGTVTCSKNIAHCGETIQLIAVPDEDSVFVNWSCNEVVIADPMLPSITVTMPGQDITVIANFSSRKVVATRDWVYGTSLPGKLDSSLLDIEYEHIYEMQAVTSPGNGWERGAVVQSEFINSGSAYESDFELAVSETRALVDYYYYHWCSASTGVWVNFAPTEKYVHYDDTKQIDKSYYFINSSQTDSADSRYTCYTLKWNAGGWLKCKGGDTCDMEHDWRSQYWYKRYIYQDKVLQETYLWTRTSGWVPVLDTTASSYTVRWKLKENFAPDLILPSNLTSIEDEAFSGIKNIIIEVPEAVNYISETAFDSSVTILCTEGSYAAERCYDLGLTIFYK